MPRANGMTSASRSRLANSHMPLRFADTSVPMLDGVASYAERIESAFERGDFTGPWLLMHGPRGNGKTSQACEVLKRCLEYKLGQFFSAAGYLDRIKYGWDHDDSIDVASVARGTALLVLDDFGKERITEWSCTQMFELLDYRWSNRKATIITSNYAPAELAKAIGEASDKSTADALMSRICDSENVLLAVSGADRRSRRG